MSADYLLQLDLDGEHHTRTLTDTTPQGVAAEIHRHARGILGGGRVTVHYDAQTLTGTITSNGAHAGRFALTLIDAEPAGDDGPGREDGIRWGWTLTDLDQAVRTGIARNTWYRGIDTDERYAAGWHAAVELLYTSNTPPTGPDLVRAAWYAADALTGRTAEERGVPRQRGEGYTGRTDMPRWHAYWTTVCRHTPSPEEPIVERTALGQIWPRLTPGQQAALQALAAHGDYRSAADALGLTYHAFFRRVSSARKRVLALWWEGETPRRGWRDRRAWTEPTQLHSVSAHIRKRRRAGVAA